MTRGRHPVRALEEAEPIAKKRGLIQYYERGPGMLADFSISVPSCLVLVKIKRMRYIRCTPQWLDREAFGELAGLKMYPSSAEISRELWICSPDYCWRFLRSAIPACASLTVTGQSFYRNLRAQKRR